jgi:hypothetical protein
MGKTIETVAVPVLLGASARACKTFTAEIV